MFSAIADGRTMKEQSLCQFLALIITIAIAIIGGCVAGKICSCLSGPEELFDDTENFMHCELPNS